MQRRCTDGQELQRRKLLCPGGQIIRGEEEGASFCRTVPVAADLKPAQEQQEKMKVCSQCSSKFCPGCTNTRFLLFII